MEEILESHADFQPELLIAQTMQGEVESKRGKRRVYVEGLSIEPLAIDVQEAHLQCSPFLPSLSSSFQLRMSRRWKDPVNSPVVYFCYRHVHLPQDDVMVDLLRSKGLRGIKKGSTLPLNKAHRSSWGFNSGAAGPGCILSCVVRFLMWWRFLFGIRVVVSLVSHLCRCDLREGAGRSRHLA